MKKKISVALTEVEIGYSMLFIEEMLTLAGLDVEYSYSCMFDRNMQCWVFAGHPIDEK